MLKPLIFAGLTLGTAACRAELPDLNDARVSIPYAELKSLWQASQRDKEAEKPKPPVDAMLLSARYQLTLQPGQTGGVAEFEAQSFRDGWTLIPLIGSEAQLDKVEPQEARIILRDGRHTLVLDKPGKTVLKLHFAAKLTSDASGEHLRLPIPEAPVSCLTLNAIPDNKVLSVKDATQVSSAKGTADYRLPAKDCFEIDLQPVAPPPVASRWKTQK